MNLLFFFFINTNLGCTIAFFNAGTVLNSATNEISDMPANFTVGLGDMVPRMGGHAWNIDEQPNALTWVEPIWVRQSFSVQVTLDFLVNLVQVFIKIFLTL